MNKSIEVVLQESLLQAAEDGGTTVNGLVTIRLEALKEIEAILSQLVIGEDKILPKYLTEWDEKDGEEYWYNKLRAEQRQALTNLIRGDK